MDEQQLFAAYEWDGGDSRWVRVNMVMALNGAQALNGTSGAMSNTVDFRLFHHLRGGADLVLVGARTAIAEKYTGVFVSDSTVADRRRRGQSAFPALAVLTRHGKLPLDAPFFQHTPVPTLIVVTGGSEAQWSFYRDIAMEIGEDRCRIVDARAADGRLGGALAALDGLGFRNILCEGGPAIVNSLASSNLIDELCLTLSPMFAGGSAEFGQITQPDLFTPQFTAVVDDFLFSRWQRIPGSASHASGDAAFRTFNSIAGEGG